MTMTTLKSFDTTLHKTNLWLDEIAEQLGRGEDRQVAYDALRATLHALRDRLPVKEAADLAAQLPMLVRGIYYEGWSPTGKPVKDRKREEFLAHVVRELRGHPELDPEAVVKSVLRVVENHVAGGELQDVKANLPSDIRQLWPNA